MDDLKGLGEAMEMSNIKRRVRENETAIAAGYETGLLSQAITSCDRVNTREVTWREALEFAATVAEFKIKSGDPKDIPRVLRVLAG